MIQRLGYSIARSSRHSKAAGASPIQPGRTATLSRQVGPAVLTSSTSGGNSIARTTICRAIGSSTR